MAEYVELLGQRHRVPDGVYEAPEPAQAKAAWLATLCRELGCANPDERAARPPAPPDPAADDDAPDDDA